MTARATEIETAPVHHLAETGSTNEDALAAGRGGTTGPLWIRAERQLSGRGRQGRNWDSPVGNLYCSLLIPVAADPARLPQLSQVAAVALATALAGLLGPEADLRIKWPNDLLLNGAKVAGILVEGTTIPTGHRLCVIGCGVNCGSYPADLPYRATCLAEAAGRAIQPEGLFALLRPAMAEAIEAWDDGRGYATIRQRWLVRALPLETPLVVRGPREPVSGRFQGIDEQGRLLLLGSHGPLTVEAGEVNLN